MSSITEWAPDCDLYTDVIDCNVFGFDGHDLLGERNPILESDRRPPAEAVTPAIALRVFKRLGPGHFCLEHGWPERRNVAALTEQLFIATAAEPPWRLELRHGDPVLGYRPILESIQDRAPAIAEIQLGHPVVTMGTPRSPMVDLTGIALSKLRKLSVSQIGAVCLAGARLPALKELEINQDLAEPDTRFLRELGAATFPSLETVSIELARAQNAVVVDVETMRPLLEGNGLPALRDLYLGACRFEDEFFEALIESPLLRRLRRLKLRWTRMTDRGARALLRCQDELAHLELLSVEARSLSQSTLAEVRKLEPRISFRLEYGASPTQDDSPPSQRRVVHPKFGRGVVIGPSEGDEKLTVDFEGIGRKTVLARFLVDD